MRTLKFSVYGTVIGLTTNSDRVSSEIQKDFGTFQTREDAPVDGRVKIVETDAEFPLKIPEYAIRESILPPDSATYILSNQRFFEEKNKRFVMADFERNEITGYAKRPYDISHFTRFLLKWMLIKALENRKIFFIHGSGVTRDRHSLFFVGPASFGKTSILVTLLQDGYRMITDDTVLLSDGKVLPFHMRSMIHEDMLRRFPILKKGLNDNTTYIPQQGWLIDLKDIFPVVKEEKRPSKLFYVYIWNSRETKIEEISKKEMLSRLFQVYLREMGNSIWSGWNKSGVVRKLFPSYHTLVEKVDCYKTFAGSDIHEFKKKIESVVK